MPAQVQEASSYRYAWDRFFFEVGGIKAGFWPDCEADFEGGSLIIRDRLLYLRLGTHQYGKYLCLVLKQ
jgi:hypothetical protein